MADRYLRRKIEQNWQTLLILLLSVIFLSIVIKNISQIPYQNKHKMQSTIPLKFEYNDKTVKGFVYLSYWVETNRNIDKNLSNRELNNYLKKYGYIDLRNHEDELTMVLKDYSLSKIKNNWYNDLEYFKQNDIYYISNDRKLYNKMKELNFDIALAYEIKKSFFVYLDSTNFAEFVEEHKN